MHKPCQVRARRLGETEPQNNVGGIDSFKTGDPRALGGHTLVSIYRKSIRDLREWPTRRGEGEMSKVTREAISDGPAILAVYPPFGAGGDSRY